MERRQDDPHQRKKDNEAQHQIGKGEQAIADGDRAGAFMAEQDHDIGVPGGFEEREQPHVEDEPTADDENSAEEIVPKRVAPPALSPGPCPRRHMHPVIVAHGIAPASAPGL